LEKACFTQKVKVIVTQLDDNVEAIQLAKAMAHSRLNTAEKEKVSTNQDDHHQKLIKNTESTLNTIFANDPLMRDLNFVELGEIREKVSGNCMIIIVFFAFPIVRSLLCSYRTRLCPS
jgi:hypothetical protein